MRSSPSLDANELWKFNSLSSFGSASGRAFFVRTFTQMSADPETVQQYLNTVTYTHIWWNYVMWCGQWQLSQDERLSLK